jgi:DNA polymerase
MSSIRINRAERFLATSRATGGKFPIPLNHCAAHTGRWGGADKLNAQNLPPGPLRESLVAPRHHVVLVVDLSQIEARVTAWLAEHFLLLEQFADPLIDVYSEFAAQYYGIPVDQIKKKSKERFVGKTCILGLGFGMGWKKLRHQFATKFAYTGIVLSKDEAAKAVQLYRSINYPIKAFWDFLNYTVIPRMASAEGGMEYGYKCIQYGRDYVRLPSGRCLLYPNLRPVDGEWPDGEPKIDWVYDYKGGISKLYGGKFTENLAQAIARDLNADFMLEIDKHYPLATMTHDENVVIPHIGQAKEALKLMTSIMITPPKWAPDLPLSVEGAYNERYTK